MKAETDINLKARFYAQYIGQKVIEGSEYPLTMWDLAPVVLSGLPLCLNRFKEDRDFWEKTIKHPTNYVVNYCGYTVEDLIQLGWVKIIEK